MHLQTGQWLLPPARHQQDSTMPDSHKVNEQITDAVTQTNVNVVAEAPAQAMGSFYQVASHANGLAMENATANQHNLNQLNPAILANAVSLIQMAKPKG